MRYITTTIIVTFLIPFFISCENKVALVPQTAPIIATSDNQTSYYLSKGTRFSRDTLYILGTDTTQQVNGYAYIGLTVNAKNTGTYLLSAFPMNYAYTSWHVSSLNAFSYQTDSVRTGSINIKKLDTVNHIAIGTFNFTAEEQLPLRYGNSLTLNGSFNLKW